MDDCSWRQGIETHYSGLLRTMFTLLLTISGGKDWYDVLQPLIRLSWVWFYPFLFSMYVLGVMLGVTNLVSAVFVEQALQIRDKDLVIQSEIDKTKDFLRDMSELFKEADTDNSSTVTWDELDLYLRDDRVVAYMAVHQLDVLDIKNMFMLLDANGNGEIELSEFALGTMRLKGQARCIDVMRIFQCFDAQQLQLERIQAYFGIPHPTDCAPNFHPADMIPSAAMRESFDDGALDTA